MVVYKHHIHPVVYTLIFPNCDMIKGNESLFLTLFLTPLSDNIKNI